MAHLLHLMKQGWAAKEKGSVRDIQRGKLSSTPTGRLSHCESSCRFRLHPITGKAHDFYVMDCPDWVNIVAVTTDQRLILVRQYRHGTDTVDLEFRGASWTQYDNSEFTAIR